MNNKFNLPDLRKNEKVNQIEIKGVPMAVPIIDSKTGRVVQSDRERLAEALELLARYENIEAQLIGTDDCWGSDGEHSSPRFTDDQWEEFISLQDQRNKVLQREGYY